ncbi:MAG: hypothetical protein V2A69_09615 [Pseudomonadota bacterium]
MLLVTLLVLLIATTVQAEYPWLDGYAMEQYTQSIITEFEDDGIDPIGELGSVFVAGNVIVGRDAANNPIFKYCVLMGVGTPDVYDRVISIYSVRPGGQKFLFATCQGGVLGILFMGNNIIVQRWSGVGQEPPYSRTLIMLKPKP